MFGREELNKLRLEKQVLVATSNLHRLMLQVELQNLRSATAWLSETAQGPRKAGSLMLLLAPLAGILLSRVSGRGEGWFKRGLAVVKWVGPLYQLWRSFSAKRKAGAGKPLA